MSKKDSYIIDAVRTPIGKFGVSLASIRTDDLAAHVIRSLMDRHDFDPGKIDDVIMGCANPEGATGHNIARQIALRAGLPVSASGMTVNRFCSSGLQTVALAAQRVISGEAEVFVAGGVESISCVQNEMNAHFTHDQWLAGNKPEIYWSMLQTAEQVASRYEISREDQDHYGVQSDCLCRPTPPQNNSSQLQR